MTSRPRCQLLRFVFSAALAAAAPLAMAQGVAFSAAKPGDPLPAGWQNLPVVQGKTLTRYSLVDDHGTTVLQADAQSAASGLMHTGDDVDLSRMPVVSWRWKATPIEGANNSEGSREDAPARLVFVFGGDESGLSIGDRAELELTRHIGGQPLPYATLMYIWSNTAPPGTVIANPHTSRVEMIVVSGTSGDAGQWRTITRNVAHDYEEVFHEKPGKLTGYGLLTDTDNTRTTTRAWYGDIRFRPAH